MIRRRSILVLVLVVLAQTLNVSAQETADMDLDMASIGAQDEFAWGVRSFHSSLYNEAIRSFEQSLSYKPDNPLTRYWLGLTYMRSGFDETALSIWSSLMELGNPPSITESKIELLSWKRGVGKELEGPGRQLVSFSLGSWEEDLRLFARPSSVGIGKNGDFYLASYASNEVLLFSINAGLRTRIAGGIEGYNKPFDILAIPERNMLFVSEYGADRITRSTLDGKEIVRFGKRGRGPGEFLGPQYLALDEAGHLYVSDIGNRRISKFDLDGTFLFSFGGRTGDFPGLQEPAGIAVMNGLVYVSDTRKKEISVFDGSGNYIRSIGGGVLSKPEGLSLYGTEGFLVADGPRVYLYTARTEEFLLFSDFGGTARRVTRAVPAKDGVVLVTDFEGDTVYFLSDFHGLYSNLDVEILKVDSTKFPTVRVDFTVEDAAGNPMIGLDSSNFVVTERRRDTGEFQIVYTGNSDTKVSLSILLERSPEMKNLASDTATALKDLTAALPRGGIMRLVSASAEPVIEVPAGSNPRQFTSPGSLKSSYDRQWRFDTGLRLAASELLPEGAKRAVIFVTSGACPDNAFDRYSLVELARYLKNNGIRFYCVSVDPMRRPVSAEYRYLCEETGGSVHLLYQPEGIGAVIPDILNMEVGRYVIQYTSREQTDFGNAYIPIEVEVHHFSRSGRDELGYFGPITF